MLASILSLGLLGIEGFVVTTEVNLAPGMPAFDVVGLPDAAVKESRERVRAALRNCGYIFPNACLRRGDRPAGAGTDRRAGRTFAGRRGAQRARGAADGHFGIGGGHRARDAA